jgi:hypothetical protein
MTITIKTAEELEQMTAAELASYEQLVKASIAALKNAAWDIDMELWTRDSPAHMAERSALNAAIRARSAATDPRPTIIAELAQAA